MTGMLSCKRQAIGMLAHEALVHGVGSSGSNLSGMLSVHALLALLGEPPPSLVPRDFAIIRVHGEGGACVCRPLLSHSGCSVFFTELRILLRGVEFIRRSSEHCSRWFTCRLSAAALLE